MDVAILRRFFIPSVLFLLMMTEFAIEISLETIAHQSPMLTVKFLVRRGPMVNLKSKRNNTHLSKQVDLGDSIGISLVDKRKRLRLWKFPPFMEVIHSSFVIGVCRCTYSTLDEYVISMKVFLILHDARYPRFQSVKAIDT
ncbi:unnamed protein product [Arabidopsis halleri]